LGLSFVRPILVKTRWWKEVIWSALGAGIGAILAVLALFAFLSVTGNRLSPEAGQGLLVVILAPPAIGLLLGGFLGFALSRADKKRGK
jgi:ABC-type Fe3+-siderophore transport system permease subunit